MLHCILAIEKNTSSNLSTLLMSSNCYKRTYGNKSAPVQENFLFVTLSIAIMSVPSLGGVEVEKPKNI